MSEKSKMKEEAVVDAAANDSMLEDMLNDLNNEPMVTQKKKKDKKRKVRGWW